MTEWMRQAVDEVYRQWIGTPAEWTPQQRDRFIDTVTQGLDQLAGELAVDVQEGAIRRWTLDHQGSYPEHATKMALYQTSLENAREAIVRRELYDKIPRPEEDADYQPPVPIHGVPWEKRWTDLRFQVEPTEAVQELANRVWPDHSPMFRVVAALLLAVRVQDGMAVPNSDRHVLAAALAAEINEELVKTGYPAE